MEDQIKILVVDDEGITRKELQDNLQAEGYAVDVAEDGAGGLEKIEKTAYNVIITDLVMPGEIDGLKLVEKIKEISPETIKIIITGFPGIESAVKDHIRFFLKEAMRLGAYYYLEKPIKFDLVLDTISKGLNEHPESIKKVRMRAEDLIYEKYRDELEKGHQKGEFVAIDLDTEEIIVDKDDGKVLDKAIKKFGKMKFLFRRIGYNYVYSVGGGHYDN